MTTEIKIRIAQGDFERCVVNSDCPVCGKESGTDIGKGDLKASFDIDFWCPDCDFEWGVTFQLQPASSASWKAPAES